MAVDESLRPSFLSLHSCVTSNVEKDAHGRLLSDTLREREPRLRIMLFHDRPAQL